MKSLSMTLLIWLSVALVPAQTAAPGAQEKQKGMMQGNMSGMMEHCRMHCGENMTAMNTLAKQVEEARQSNDVSKMRAALDAVSKHHAQMREHMQTCMRNMRPGDAKQSGEQHGHSDKGPARK